MVEYQALSLGLQLAIEMGIRDPNISTKNHWISHYIFPLKNYSSKFSTVFPLHYIFHYFSIVLIVVANFLLNSHCLIYKLLCIFF